ncbi:VOC family protein [Paraburkholderia nemoris]|uniref:VOC family protein n=1 Tax=Paraburkholderia nemoris TaxID=2793076 RepID=UPI0038B72828
MNPDMRIVGLHALRFGVEDVEAAARFFSDWNLRVVARGPGATFETEEGAQVVILRSDDPSLPPPVGGKSQLREIVWAVESNNDIERVADELSKDRDVSVVDGVARTIDDSGYGLAFVVSSFRALAATNGDVNFPGVPVRVNRAVDFTARPSVRHLGHMAMFVPNFEEAMEFYTSRLGFRVSDVYPGRGVFLRAAGSHDHHNLFLVHRGDMVGFHHMSFEVSDFHQIMQGGRQMQRNGWKTQFGPGRHTLGSNYFWYFHTPFGGACEYYSDMDYLDDSWEGRTWEYSPDVIAAWTAHVPDENVGH